MSQDSSLVEEARLLRSNVITLVDQVSNLAKRHAASEITAKRVKLTIFGLIFSLIVDVGLTAIILHEGVQLRQYTNCQSDYNEMNNARTRALTEANNQERVAQRRVDDAERTLFTDPAISKPANQRTTAENEKVAQLFADYQNALNALSAEHTEADKARAENPVPEPPSVTCRNA